MMTLTADKREKSREFTRKTQNAAKRKANRLTCTEAEVEAILSEGEST